MRRTEGLAEAATKAGLTLVAVLYGRVSDDKHGDQRSVDEQEDRGRAECADHGWAIHGRVYADPDMSASRFARGGQRPEWNELLEDLAAKRFHVLVLWEPSRGDRDLESWIKLLNLCRRLGVLIHITSHHHTYDVRNRRDYKTLAEEGVDSADESEKTSGRIVRAMEALARKGLPTGPCPYGYRREYTIDERGKRKLVGQYPDQIPRTATAVDGTVSQYTPAGVIAEMGSRCMGGESPHTVAVDLNRRGVPTAVASVAGWTHTEVVTRITNPVYAGLSVYWEEVVGPAVWDPIIPVADHHALVARYSEPDRRHVKETKIKHLGSGLYVCGVCGGPIRTTKNPTVGAPPPARRYTCTPDKKVGAAKRGGVRGYCVSRDVTAVDAYVQLSIWRRLARPDIADLLAEDDKADDKTANLKAEIAEKQGRLDKARDAYAAGRLPLASVERIEATLGPEITRARAAMNQSRYAPVLDGLMLPTVEAIRAEWFRRSMSRRREVIRVLTERVEILAVNHRRIYEPEESVGIVWRKPGR
jgi:site-specific DNA recombinase